jgi:hypothetical protein
VFTIVCLPLGRRVVDIAESIWISAVTTPHPSFLHSRISKYIHHDISVAPRKSKATVHATYSPTQFAKGTTKRLKSSPGSVEGIEVPSTSFATCVALFDCKRPAEIRARPNQSSKSKSHLPSAEMHTPSLPQLQSPNRNYSSVSKY